MSAPTSPSRTRRRRWRLRSRTTAPARSAPPTRCGTTAGGSFRPTPTSRASPPISTPAVPGWEKRAGDAVVLGAGGSARGVIYGLIERGIAQHPRRQPHAGAGAGACRRGSAPRCSRRNHAALPHLLSRAALLVNTTSLGMTGQPPLRDRSRPAAASGRGRRPGLCAAGNAVAGRGARPRAGHRRWPRHAAASGGAGLPALVRGPPRGDPAIAGAGRDRPRRNKGILPVAGGYTAGQ